MGALAVVIMQDLEGHQHMTMLMQIGMPDILNLVAEITCVHYMLIKLGLQTLGRIKLILPEKKVFSEGFLCKYKKLVMSRLHYILLLALLFSFCGNRNAKNRISENLQHSVESVVYEEKFVEDLSSIVTIPIYSSVSNHNNNLSAIASDIEFVALDFEPPLGDPFHLRNIELSENRIFLSWLYDIYSYDIKGRFIRKIGRRGQGTQEFINIPTMQIDRENSLLYAADVNRRRMIVYRFDGSFEKAFSIGEKVYFVILAPNILAWRQDMIDRGKNPAPLIEFTTSNGEKIKTLWSNNFPLPINKERRFLGPDTSPLWNYGNNFYYMEYGTDTIFRISENSLDPIRILIGDLKLNLIDHFEIGMGRRLRLVTPITRINSGIFESSYYMVFRLGSDNERFFMVYNKKTKALHRTHHRNSTETLRGERLMDYFVDDMFTGLNLNPMYQSMGKAIAVIPAHEIYEQKQEILGFIKNNPNDKSRHLKQIVENITDDCNPVLAIITFR
jgi:hypothetical protein